jgi:hypothetical protein
MDQEILVKLSRDMKSAAETMTANQARYLTSLYLTMQRNRKAADQKIAKMVERSEGEPHAVLTWASDNALALESQILGALKAFALSQPMGRWAMGILGVGPIVASGLLAHVDIDKCPTAGHLWAFAGFDPSKKWGKGEKRPHNAALKQIGYYAGESFIKLKGNPECAYGRMYDERKAYEQAKNEAGDYAEFARAYLERRPTHAQAKTYKSGKLPAGHLHARARRWVIKMFLAHWFEEAYWKRHGREAPLAYPVAVQKHAHYVERPNPRTA